MNYFEDVYSKRGKTTNLKQSVIFNKFSLSIPDDIVKGVKSSIKRNYSKKYIKSIIAIYFSLMAQKLKETNMNTSFDMNSLGYLTMDIRPKVCKLTFPPTVKMNAKRMNFKFKLVFKRTCWKVFNQDKIDDVVEYIRKKKRSRNAAIQYAISKASCQYYQGYEPRDK